MPFHTDDGNLAALNAHEARGARAEQRMERAEGEAADRIDEVFADELGDIVSDAGADMTPLLLAVRRGNVAPLLEWLDAQEAHIRERLVSDIYEVAA